MPLEFVKFARAKGLSERRIVFVHVLKRILIPIVTVIGLEFVSVIAFAVLTATLFSCPGIGTLLSDSLPRLERPLDVASLLFVVCPFLVVTFLVDVLYPLLDPRLTRRQPW